MKVFGAAFAAAILLFGGAAQAQSGNPGAEGIVRIGEGGAWTLVRTREGCAVILYSDDVRETQGEAPTSGLTYQWSGTCGADGLASGPGVLTASYHSNGFDGSYNNRFEIRGSTSAGLFEGRTTDTESADNRGAMRVLDLGDFPNPRENVRTGGCAEEYTECEPGAGRQLSATVRARGVASYFGGGTMGSGQRAEGPGSAAPKGGLVTAVATPSVRAGRNPFLNSCLSLKAPEGDREPGSWGANIWTIQNSCQTKLYVTWCADDDGREALRNICSNKAAVTNELLAGGTIIFQSVARELSIQAFACRAPDFPQDAGFTEDRRLTASGCP